MSFKNEEQMYPIIRNWLLDRETDPCVDVVIDKPKGSGYKFKYGTKSYCADLLGVYEKDGFARHVGIEAKSSARTTQKSLRQAEGLQSFCQEVFVAMPDYSFKKLPEQDKNDLVALMHRKQMGLLLVSKNGIVEENISRKIPVFRFDLYKEAEEYWRDFSKSEVKDILNSFINKRYYPHYPLLKDNWEIEELDYSFSLVHNDDLKKNRGRILLNPNEITVELDIEYETTLKWWHNTLVEHDKELLDDAVEKIVENIKNIDDLKCDKTKGTPSLVFLDEDDNEAMRISLQSLKSRRAVMKLFSSAIELGCWNVKVVLEYKRPLSLIPKLKEQDYIDDLRDIYTYLHPISNALEGKG